MHNLFPNPRSSSPNLARLSDRELQVFQLLGAGRGNREIAQFSPKLRVRFPRPLARLGQLLPDGITDEPAAVLGRNTPHILCRQFTEMI
jgi:hypothetical protein